MKLELTPEETAIVHDLIEHRLEELGPEIHHTRTSEYKDGLKHFREQLQKLLDRLMQAAA